MDASKIKAAVAEINSERDPTLKALKLASLCSALWKERGVQLVVVGGSAIELLTEGEYTSGDIDLCTVTGTLPLRDRQEVMALLGAKGGPRSWEVAGAYVDLLGEAESFGRTSFRRVEGPYGEVWVMKPEDLLVERVLVAVYPEKNETARLCARELVSASLRGLIDMDWNEILRIAALREYCNVDDCKALVNEVADEIHVKSPFDPA